MRPFDPAAPERPIVGFHRDDDGDWVAELACGHGQHVRHAPPWQQREWVTSQAGRTARLGSALPCMRCLEDGPIGTPPR